MAATAASAVAGSGQAGGLDRSGTPIEVLFEQGNYAEVSFGYSDPELTGVDLLGNPIADVGKDFSVYGLALKGNFNEKLSFAIILDKPYGADVQYGGNPLTTLLGGTLAEADSTAVTALIRYRTGERFSIYGGPRFLKADGQITLSGLAYGAANGYNVQLNEETGAGFVAGAAYEIPDIAFRTALTYHSQIDLNFNTVENFPGPLPPLFTGTTSSNTPQSVKLDVQTGVAPKTLAFGSVRWSEWSGFTIIPPALGSNLAELDDVVTYELGVGRQFTDKFSAQVSVSYEDGGSDSLVSPLAPTNGQTALSVGGKYMLSEKVSLSGGIHYTWLGDAVPETGTPDTPRASFANNGALSGGFKVGFHF
ncbi:OmpP1/FadL family transporter [Roseovarius salinarum]|uniref:OmpP1/FadL family transporter n=1 Tax=Roseovarius salinarum TaxID=1981892 RepID=UPI001E476788|nr:outer membrane protein transport protein [Roseovarius salinarum]